MESKSQLQKMLAQIVTFSDGYGEGKTQTIIPFFSISRRSAPTQIVCGMINPSFCVVAQGVKSGYIGNDVVSYGSGDFVAASVDMPATAQVSEASKQAPYVSVSIEFNRKEIASIIDEAKLHVCPKDAKTIPGCRGYRTVTVSPGNPENGNT